MGGSSASLLKRGGHKYEHGHALVIAGGPGAGGAARLAARSALRIGAGLVTLAPSFAAMTEHSGKPDALMRQSLDSPEEVAPLVTNRRISAIAIGPGCGIERAAALLSAVLQTDLPMVIDADAITALPQSVENMPLRPNIVLTPHRGEFQRMLPDLAAKLGKDDAQNLTITQQAAHMLGATVLLKGPVTSIATPTGESAQNDARDVPWLATAGSGDVLTGIITGLLARGFTPLDAARNAAHIHTEAARRFGPGLIADDLPEQIPAILRDWA